MFATMRPAMVISPTDFGKAITAKVQQDTYHNHAHKGLHIVACHFERLRFGYFSMMMRHRNFFP